MKKRLKFLLSIILVLIVSQLYGQTRNVKGVVVGENDGEPLGGVSVLVKGTFLGTLTDANGLFSIAIPSERNELEFKYLGYLTQTVFIADKAEITVRLVIESHELEDIVVTGYTSQRLSEISSSVSVVSGEKLNDVTSSDLSSLLQGKAPGIVVSNSSGSPNSKANIVVRGSGSISAGAYPLYVVDGVIGGTADPNDIESVTILKDAAATGLYGSRASNGVIIITTKSGKSGKTRINFSSIAGFNEALKGNSRPMNSQELYDFHKSFYKPEEFAIDRPASLLETNIDWWDIFYRTALTQRHALSVSGGSEKTQVYVSGNYYNEAGTLINTGRKTYNLRSNVSHKINDKLKINVNFNGRVIDTENEASGDYGATTGATGNIPWDSPYHSDGTLKRGNEPGWVGREYRSYIYDLQYNFDYNKGYGLDIDAGLDYSILSNLVFTTINRISYNNSKRELLYDSRSQTSQSSGVGYLENWINSGHSLITSNRLKYDKSFGLHEVRAIAVLEGEKNFHEDSNVAASHVPIGLRVIDAAALLNRAAGNTSENAFNKGLVQVDYSFNNRFFVVGSFINESSSRFGANNRSANFYTLGTSWILSNERFMEKISFVNQLKLRASYGLVGNANIGNYQSLGLYTYAAQYNNNSASYPFQLSNPDLTWEKTGAYNFGVDLNLFNRITLNVDLYNKTSDDLLLNVDKAYTSGFSSMINNVGSVRNTGSEINLVTKNVDRSEFKWETSFNIAFNKNRVLKLDDGKDITIPYEGSAANVRISEGRDMNSYYMRKFSRVNPENGEPLWELDVVGADGQITVTETNNYTIATQKYVGTASPKFTGGIFNTLSYKRFSISAFANFTYGNMRTGYGYADGDAQTSNVRVLAKGETIWQKPGDIATYPRAIFGGNLQSTKISSLNMGSGSYFRLRNVTLGYELPSNFLQKINVAKARVYVSGDNLWTSTRFPGTNPEVIIWNSGADTGDYNRGQYPLSMKMLLGINLEF